MFAFSPVPVRAIAIGIAYFVMASAVLIFARTGGGLAILWFASALLVAELGQSARRDWMAPSITCLIAAALASALFGLGPGFAIPFATLTVGEAIMIATILHWARQGATFLDSLDGIIVFMLGTMASVALTATIGGMIAATRPQIDFIPAWQAWFTGHALGTVTMAPIAALALSGEFNAWWRAARQSQKLEAAALLVLMVAVSLLVFRSMHLPILFLPVLPLMIATFRLDRIGTALGIVIVAIIGGAYTATGHGPVAIVSDAPLVRAMFFQLYLAATLLTVLPVAAALKQLRVLYDRMMDSEARYKLITENATDIVLALDIMGKVTYASPSVRELVGVAPDSLIGKRPQDIPGGPDASAVATAYRGVFANPAAISVIEYQTVIASGEMRWFEAQTRGIFADGSEPTGWVSTIRDISPRKILELKLAHAATTDPLTGLANRRAFDAVLDLRIDRMGAGERGGCIAIFDIDFFKRVNDQYGHGVGDMVLAEFAETTRRAIRAGDHIARLGGEEFGVIFAGADLSRAAAICERLRRKVAQHVTTASDGTEVSVTVSAGIARIEAGLTRSQIMRAADEALYRAKASGRDCLSIAA